MTVDLATLSWNQIQKFFFVSVGMIQKSATRKYFEPQYKSNFLKKFFSYDGENYIQIDESKYSHEYTSGLGNLEGRAVTTGCYPAFYADYYYYNYTYDNYPDENYATRDCSVKTEILDISTMTWSDADDYPYGR